MIKKLCIVMAISLAAFLTGCSKTNETANANANANTATTAEAVPATRQAPDNSEVMTTIDANGVKTETRTFRNNPRIAKVVVTTRNGVKTGKAVSPSGEERELDKNEVEEALDATGEKVAAAAGFIAENAKPAINEAADKTEDVKDQTVSGAKKVGEKTVEGAKTVGSGAKKVGSKAVSETKKAVKKVIP